MRIINLTTRELKIKLASGDILTYPASASPFPFSQAKRYNTITEDGITMIEISCSKTPEFPSEITGAYYVVDYLQMLLLQRTDLLVPSFDENGFVTEFFKYTPITN